MSHIIHLDFETYSEADLKKVGAFRYGADPSTEILMAAVQLDDGEPFLWVPERHESEELWSDSKALEVMALWQDPSAIVVAHNASFEHAIARYCMERQMGISPPAFSQWRCTAAMARRAAVPASLEGAAKDLGLAQQKDTKGKALIRKFSIPQIRTLKGVKKATRNMPADFAVDFAEFGEYCKQDVRTETQVFEALKDFALSGTSLETFQLDIRMNHAGIPVNVSALSNAQKIIDEIDTELFATFSKLTGGLTPTQRDKVVKFLKNENFPLDGLRAAELTDFINSDKFSEMTPLGQRVLKIRHDLGYAAVKKVAAMLACECGDGYVRGTLQYHGASTGRWAGRLIQPHNFKRPTIKDTDGAYSMICEGATREEISIVYGNPYEVISSCIRHFIQPHEGKFYGADYAAIEARLVCWLAGDEPALQEFRDKIDNYIRMGSLIFGTPESVLLAAKERDEFTIERFVGKQAILGCGYGMGVQKFIDTCASYGQKIDYEIGQKAIKTFREIRKPIAQLWYSCDNAIREAILNPDRQFKAGKRLAFFTTRTAGRNYIFMKLPCGRKVAYPEPKLEDKIRKFEKKDGTVEKKKVTEITYYGQIPNSALYGRISTYGAKIVENATQAVAADIMSHGMVTAEAEGFDLITTIHDEAIAHAHPTLTIEDFVRALTKLPTWAAGLPLEADGKVVPYYRK